MVYKQQHNLLPEIFANMYYQNSGVRQRSTRQDTHIFIKQYKTTYGEHAVKVTGAKLWNCLPGEIRNMESLYIFKRAVKQFILSKWNLALN